MFREILLKGNSKVRETKSISETEIPKILGSNPNGSLLLSNISISVVEPPPIIAQNAPIELAFFQKKAPRTGMKSPETINAYE